MLTSEQGSEGTENVHHANGKSIQAAGSAGGKALSAWSICIVYIRAWNTELLRTSS